MLLIVASIFVLVNLKTDPFSQEYHKDNTKNTYIAINASEAICGRIIEYY